MGGRSSKQDKAQADTPDWDKILLDAEQYGCMRSDGILTGADCNACLPGQMLDRADYQADLKALLDDMHDTSGLGDVGSFKVYMFKCGTGIAGTGRFEYTDPSSECDHVIIAAVKQNIGGSLGATANVYVALSDLTEMDLKQAIMYLNHGGKKWTQKDLNAQDFTKMPGWSDIINKIEMERTSCGGFKDEEWLNTTADRLYRRGYKGQPIQLLPGQQARFTKEHYQSGVREKMAEPSHASATRQTLRAHLAKQQKYTTTPGYKF